MFDTHVNLTAEAFADDCNDVIHRARQSGVTRFMCICARWSDLDTVRALTEAHSDVYGSAGAHPHHAKDEPEITTEAILERAAYPKCVAIGETGLDLHYNYSPFEQQIASFRAHIGAARQSGLPLIVHSREADQEMADVLEDETRLGEFRFLLHCFTSGPDLARRGANLGAYFSVNGILTFKNATEVREIVADFMPEDRILLETDAPYLAPTPHRGRRNEPAYLHRVAEALADIKGWSVDETIERTTDNAYRFFDRVDAPTRDQSPILQSQGAES